MQNVEVLIFGGESKDCEIHRLPSDWGHEQIINFLIHIFGGTSDRLLKIEVEGQVIWKAKSEFGGGKKDE